MERSTFSGFLSIFSTKVVVVVVSLLTTPLLVRFLTKAQYGDYAFVLSVFGIYMILVSSGVGDGVRKYVAEDRDAVGWAESVIGFYFRAAFLLAAVGALGLALIGYLASGRWFDPRFEIYFYVLAVLVFAAQFRNFNRRVLMGLGLERYSEPLKVLNKILLMGVGLGLVSLGYGVLGMLVGYVVASGVAFLVGLYYVHREVSVRSFFERAGADLPKRELVMYNSWNIVLILLLNSLYHVDVMMLKPLAGSVETSYYKAALTLAEFLWFVPLTLQTVLLHSTSDLWSRGRHDAITDLSTRVTRYTLLLTSLFAIGLFVLAPVVVPLYLSEKYTAAVLPLRLLLPGALGFAVARPLLAIGQGKGDLSILVGGVGAAAGINLVLNFLLIPAYGPTGAAVATGIGYGSMFLFMVAAALRIGHDPLADLRGWRVLATVVISFGAIYGVNHVIESDVLSLLVVPPVGFLLFSAVAFLTGALDAEECRAISAKLPEPVGPRLARVFAWVDRPAGAAAADGGVVATGHDDRDGEDTSRAPIRTRFIRTGAQPDGMTETATFGGGCFWCTEAAMKELAGVESVTSGYAGGDTENPTYEEVCSGSTGHAEVVQVEYDPGEIGYDDLLEVFFATHDPTQLNRQGPDVGTQYRSIVLHHDDEQRAQAEAYVEALDEEYDDDVVTELEPLERFWEAEEYHQDYFEKNPTDAYCRMHAQPKVEKVRETFAEKVEQKTH